MKSVVLDSIFGDGWERRSRDMRENKLRWSWIIESWRR
jgi:hypothetical protein